MIFYKSKDFKVGVKIELNNEPYVIIENEFVNPGKGQAFNRLKIKNIISGLVVKKTVKLGERLKSADLFEVKAKYLYFENDFFYFMDESSYEYYDVSSDVIKESKMWLKEGFSCTLVFWNSKIINFKVPRFVELKVLNSEDVNSNSVISRSFKNAILETNVIVKVPLFIKSNDIIKIDTENCEYVSRIN
jgi:elongation factor P